MLYLHCLELQAAVFSAGYDTRLLEAAISSLKGEICLGSNIKIQFPSDRGQIVRLHYKV